MPPLCRNRRLTCLWLLFLRSTAEEVANLERQINSSADPHLQITGLRIGAKAELQQLKDGIADKRKEYRCVVVADRSLAQTDLDSLAAAGEVLVKQQTPLRVLHRWVFAVPDS